MQIQISHCCIVTAVATGSRLPHSGTEQACWVAGVPGEPVGWAGRESLKGRRRTGQNRHRHRMSRCSYRCRSMSVLLLHCSVGGQTKIIQPLASFYEISTKVGLKLIKLQLSLFLRPWCHLKMSCVSSRFPVVTSQPRVKISWWPILQTPKIFSVIMCNMTDINFSEYYLITFILIVRSLLTLTLLYVLFFN